MTVTSPERLRIGGGADSRLGQLRTRTDGAEAEPAGERLFSGLGLQGPALRRSVCSTMSRETAISNDTVIIRVPGSAEINWRTQRMVSLGAGPELAAMIADSDADVHDIERMLKAGCPLELAWTIVRPIVDKPPAEAGAVDPAV